MPTRLRPKALAAPNALLVGDPGRSLLLAQALLEQPKMSNHARGLWGYSGRALAGLELTIQATGIGGPSAALVLEDLAKLGVRRAVRVGTCTGFGPGVAPGALLLATEAVGEGSAVSFGIAADGAARPDPELLGRLQSTLGEEARPAAVASLDTMPASDPPLQGVEAADMQTLAVLARAASLEIPAAAILIVERVGERQLGDMRLEALAIGAGRAAVEALSNP
jgi:purine-nucleoside phosphorylase